MASRPRLWLQHSLQRLLTIALPILLLLSAAEAGQAANAPALIPAIERIQQKGELRVGIPPYNTPPYYYTSESGSSLAGYDIDVARALAKRLGVDVVFDQQSSSFDDLVSRAGRGEVDLAIGKLGTTYPRLYNADPHEYMRFHQALLIHRPALSQIGRDSDPRLGEKLKRASLRIGAIHKSAYDTYAKDVFPKAEIVAVKDWDAAKEALFSGRVDAIYRDATEIRMLTRQNPRLTLLYAPLVIADMLDVKSIYVGEANRGIGPVVDFLISSEFGVPDEQEIIRKYPQFYRHRA